MEAYLATLSQREVYRLCVRLHKRIYELFKGGTSYGVDWPTLNACYPQTARLWKLARKLNCELAERKPFGANRHPVS